MNEVWRPVVGFEGFYEVSDQGRVRSVDRTIAASRGKGVRFRKGALLKPTPSGNLSYLTVTLCRDGRRRTHTVHSLVLTAFVGPKPEGLECCHGDKGSGCNQLSNLSWGTKLKNLGEDKLRDDTMAWGERHAHHKLTTAQVAEIRADSRPLVDIAADYGVSAGHVSNIRLFRSRRNA